MGHDNEHLINSCANFGLTDSERAVAHPANIRLKEIFLKKGLCSAVKQLFF